MARLVVVQKDGPNVEYESSLLDCTRVCPADLFDAIEDIAIKRIMNDPGSKLFGLPLAEVLRRVRGFPHQEAPSHVADTQGRKPLSSEELEHLIWATDHPVRTALCELRAVREGDANNNSGAD